MSKIRFQIFIGIMKFAFWVCPKQERQNIAHWIREMKKVRDAIEEGEKRSESSGDFTLTLGFTREK